MGKPAARVTDMHTCPMVTPGTPPVPHAGGPILPPGCPTVLIGGLPAARVGDMATCVGPPDSIVMGSPTVLIGGMMAARLGDPTSHGGVIVMGLPTVLIGEAGGAAAGQVQRKTITERSANRVQAPTSSGPETGAPAPSPATGGSSGSSLGSGRPPRAARSRARNRARLASCLRSRRPGGNRTGILVAGVSTTAAASASRRLLKAAIGERFHFKVSGVAERKLAQALGKTAAKRVGHAAGIVVGVGFDLGWRALVEKKPITWRSVVVSAAKVVASTAMGAAATFVGGPVAGYAVAVVTSALLDSIDDSYGWSGD